MGYRVRRAESKNTADVDGPGLKLQANIENPGTIVTLLPRACLGATLEYWMAQNYEKYRVRAAMQANSNFKNLLYLFTSRA